MHSSSRYGQVALCAAALAIMLTACTGDTGATGPQGPSGPGGQDITAAAKPESCAICHGGAAVEHQSVYNAYTDATKLSASVGGVTCTSNAPAATFDCTITLSITGTDGKPFVVPFAANGTDLDVSVLPQKTVYAIQYVPGTKTFTTATASQFSVNAANFLKGATAGSYTLRNAAAKFDVTNPANNGFIYGYFAVGTTIVPVKGNYKLYPDVYNFSWIPTGVTVGYTSTANVSACENCHGKPYRKHGYRMAVVPGLADFVGCKACHTDQRVGSDHVWQQIVDDPAAWAAGTAPDTTKYAYVASVMNDTHMSHAMEFEYPQSMSGCSTCHAGHLAEITADAKFVPATCKSCHAVTANTTTQAGRAPALQALTSTAAAAASHASIDFYTAAADACIGCHATGNTGGAPTFGQIHNGFNPKIYKADGTRYADNIVATIDSTTVASNVLDIKFKVVEPAGFGVDLSTMTPTVVISLYGYDSKDFIVSGHNKDDLVTRNLECVVGGTAACTRIAVVPAGTVPGAETSTFEVTADLAPWAAMIADGTIKRAEILVMPTVKIGTTTLALNAPSKTFDLTTGAFGTSAPIVDPAKCNKCHDALGSSFHSGDRGGSVVACRVCHTTLNGGSHLEMQSRSIDSYVHAVHSFQVFDIKDVDFSNPISKGIYGLKIESTYPNFTLLNCESCHVPGAYGVPDQSKSMPGVLSASAVLTNGDRSLAVPSYVTGPASRACGACHRAAKINENDLARLAAFNGHTEANGYMLDNSAGTPSVLSGAIDLIMSLFK